MGGFLQVYDFSASRARFITKEGGLDKALLTIRLTPFNFVAPKLCEMLHFYWDMYPSKAKTFT